MTPGQDSDDPGRGRTPARRGAAPARADRGRFPVVADLVAGLGFAGTLARALRRPFDSREAGAILRRRLGTREEAFHHRPGEGAPPARIASGRIMAASAAGAARIPGGGATWRS